MNLHKNVVAHDNETVRHEVKDWEREPRLFLLGNFDGAMITMGSLPRFPMYDNDLGGVNLWRYEATELINSTVRFWLFWEEKPTEARRSPPNPSPI